MVRGCLQVRFSPEETMFSRANYQSTSFPPSVQSPRKKNKWQQGCDTKFWKLSLNDHINQRLTPNTPLNQTKIYANSENSESAKGIYVSVLLALACINFKGKSTNRLIDYFMYVPSFYVYMLRARRLKLKNYVTTPKSHEI